MTTFSPIANLPRPELTDTPNAPSQIVALTNALDSLVIPRFASAAARNAAIPTPTPGQHAWLNDSNTLTVYHAGVGQWTTYISYVGPTYYQNEDGTDITVSNTSPAAGSPVVGTTFVVPPSGNVIITITGCVETSVNGNWTIIGYELREGGTIGAGTIVQAADFESRSIASGKAVTSGGPAIANGSHRRVRSGLTPGATYNVRCMHWGSPAGAGTVRYRHIMVEPA